MTIFAAAVAAGISPWVLIALGTAGVMMVLSLVVAMVILPFI